MCFLSEMTIQASPTAFQFVYMALAINITDGHGPSGEARCELLVKKLGSIAYYPVHPAVRNCLPAVHITNKTKCLSFKVGVLCASLSS